MNGLLMLVLAVVLGAVACYFFLRANPKKKALLDTAVDKACRK
jgi:hypothetical protein